MIRPWILGVGFTLAVSLALLSAPLAAQQKATPKKAAPPKVGPIPAEVRENWKLDDFYSKYASADGLPIVASKKVNDKALTVAADVVTNMLAGRPDVMKALIEGRVRVGIIGKDEQTTDLPEYAGLRDKADFWNKRARGLGATPAALASSAGEENLLGLPTDRYRGESILVHEFAHTLHTMGLRKVDPQFEGRLKEAFDNAKKKSLWAKTYAITDTLEYWAEGVQSYFDCNMPVRQPDGIHNGITTRVALKKYDPELHDLIDGALKSQKWRWMPPVPGKN